MLFANEAVLEPIWEPSWLILGRFGIQNWDLNLFKSGLKFGANVDMIFYAFWSRFGSISGSEFESNLIKV